MKNIGIWLDKKTAYIIAETKNKENVSIILSKIKDNQFENSAHGFVKSGATEIIPDRKTLERERHLFRSYFDDIADAIKDAENIVIFGPAEMGNNLFKELELRHKSIQEKVLDLIKSDSMTKNQMKAFVRDYYSKGFSK